MDSDYWMLFIVILFWRSFCSAKTLLQEGQILCDPVNMRCLDQTNSQRKIVEQLFTKGGEQMGENKEFNGSRAYVWKDENIPEMDTDNGCTTSWNVLNAPQLHI